MKWSFKLRNKVSAFMAVVMVVTAVLSAVAVPVKAEAGSANLLVNPGFDTGDFTGWTVDGSSEAASVKSDPYSSNITNAANYYSESDFSFTLSQTVEGLENGIYVLRAEVSGSGGDNVRLFAADTGEEDMTGSEIANTGWDQWQKAELGGIKVTNGTATVGIAVDGPAGAWGWIDNFEFYKVPVWEDDKSLDAVDVAENSVTLSWSGTVTADVYGVYRDDKLLGTTDEATYEVNGLSPGTTYTFKVEGQKAGAWSENGPSVTVTTKGASPGDAAEDFIKGADISTLQAIEDAGGKYYDNGVEKDLLDILSDHGVNYIRLRLWNDPVDAGGYNDKAHVVDMARRVKESGMKLLLDFHYSDFWADPGNQVKPAAWANLSFEQLKQAVYDYTAEAMEELKEVNAYPDMVQIGNEINPGMLLPDGSANNYDSLAALLTSGIRAVRDTTPDGHKIKVMIHLAEGGDNEQFRGFFDALTARNVDFDVIGMSYYPYWHGSFQELKTNLNDMAARYGKEVVVAETSYGHTLADGDGWGNIFGQDEADEAGFPATVEGQKLEFTTVLNTVAHVPGGKGIGAFYWEPAWIPVPKDANGDYQAGWKIKEGNAWDNQAMFDFGGHALPSLDAFLFEPGDLPEKEPLLVSDPDGITVPVNEPADRVAALLPDAEVLYNEGSVEPAAVDWEPIDQDDLSRIGTFTLSGKVEGTDLTTEVGITVTAYRNVLQDPGFEESWEFKQANPSEETNGTGQNEGAEPGESAENIAWTVAGTLDSIKVNEGTGNVYSGTRGANYWYGSDFGFTLSQTVTGLANGTYVLKAKVHGGGGENAGYLFAEGYGGEKLTQSFTNTGWQVWSSPAIGGIEVANGQATVGIAVDAPANTWGWIDDFELYRLVEVAEWTSNKTLTASDAASDSVMLSWSGAADADRIAGYKIYRDGQLIGTVTGTTSYEATGLAPDTSYTFKVEASLDGSIWTSTGPSATVRTAAEPSDDTDDPDSDSGGASGATGGSRSSDHAAEIAAYRLKDNGSGKVTAEVPAGTTEVRLPGNAGDLLGSSALELKTGGFTLGIPASVLKQLAGRLDDQTGGDTIVLKLTPADETAADDYVAKAEEQSGGSIRAVGPLYDFDLYIRTDDGQTERLTEFDEPLVLAFPGGSVTDRTIAGVYFISEDGKLEYAGGEWKDGAVTASIRHFSKYGLLQVYKTFADVPQSHWAYDTIRELAAKQYVTGVSADQFQPDRAVTRAEFAAMLVGALKPAEAGKAARFADVPADAWYADDVAAAYEAGIVKGTGPDSFEPNRVITREEMAAMTVKAYAALTGASPAGGGSGSAVSFADRDDVSAWAEADVQAAYALGLVKGRSAERFMPQGASTRAEAAQIVWNLLHK
ncbi:glycosyl hydrolase 53 family protein [Paenibacillus thailandensis]|uniref:Arabinogalactan endo-beta-1,4-galactanase n=1 Tax=Paenibacillus thailandensis TaxID=393250 RepID=A0ABW5R3P3_9BACL